MLLGVAMGNDVICLRKLTTLGVGHAYRIERYGGKRLVCFVPLIPFIRSVWGMHGMSCSIDLFHSLHIENCAIKGIGRGCQHSSYEMPYVLTRGSPLGWENYIQKRHILLDMIDDTAWSTARKEISRLRNETCSSIPGICCIMNIVAGIQIRS